MEVFPRRELNGSHQISIHAVRQMVARNITTEQGRFMKQQTQEFQEWVERATCPFWRATSPTVSMADLDRIIGLPRRRDRGGKLPPRTAKLAVLPNRD